MNDPYDQALKTVDKSNEKKHSHNRKGAVSEMRFSKSKIPESFNLYEIG